jgi:hypothetical protein
VRIVRGRPIAVRLPPVTPVATSSAGKGQKKAALELLQVLAIDTLLERGVIVEHDGKVHVFQRFDPGVVYCRFHSHVDGADIDEFLRMVHEGGAATLRRLAIVDVYLPHLALIVHRNAIYEGRPPCLTDEEEVLVNFPDSDLPQFKDMLRKLIESGKFFSSTTAGDKATESLLETLDIISEVPDSTMGAPRAEKVNIEAIKKLAGGVSRAALAKACTLSLGTINNIYKTGRCRHGAGEKHEGNTLEALVAGLSKLSGRPPVEVRTLLLS